MVVHVIPYKVTWHGKWFEDVALELAVGDATKKVLTWGKQTSLNDPYDTNFLKITAETRTGDRTGTAWIVLSDYNVPRKKVAVEYVVLANEFDSPVGTLQVVIVNEPVKILEAVDEEDQEDQASIANSNPNSIANSIAELPQLGELVSLMPSEAGDAEAGVGVIKKETPHGEYFAQHAALPRQTPHTGVSIVVVEALDLPVRPNHDIRVQLNMEDVWAVTRVGRLGLEPGFVLWGEVCRCNRAVPTMAPKRCSAFQPPCHS